MLYRTMPRRRVYNPGASGKTLAYFRIPLLSTVPAALIPANTLLVLPAPLAATGPCQTPCADFTSTYQSYILQVIQYIIDRVSLDTVLSRLQELQQEITTKAQAEATIDRIESIILGIIDNITNRVNLDIVLRRLAYLKTEVAAATNLPVTYNDIATLLVYVIEQITNRESLDAVLANLITIQTNMVGMVSVADNILDIQSTLISIIENITNRVNLDIVLRRLAYAQSLVTQALAGGGC